MIQNGSTGLELLWEHSVDSNSEYDKIDDGMYRDGNGELQDSYEHTYQMLGRLKQDNDYFLGNGGRYERHLWAGNVEGQISEMKKLYSQLPKGRKPEWLTMDDIYEYERLMTQDSLNEENSLEPVEFNVPTSWLSALINGDESGFDYHGDEREYETYKKFVRDVTNEHGNAHFQHVSDEGFSRASSFDVDTLNGDMSVVSILVKRNRLNEESSFIKKIFNRTNKGGGGGGVDYVAELTKYLFNNGMVEDPTKLRLRPFIKDLVRGDSTKYIWMGVYADKLEDDIFDYIYGGERTPEDVENFIRNWEKSENKITRNNFMGLYHKLMKEFPDVSLERDQKLARNFGKNTNRR